MKRSLFITAILLGSTSLNTLSAIAFAHSTDDDNEEVIVYGRATQLLGTAESASQGVVGNDDLKNRSISRVGELVEVVPGLIATQHSGAGKANQYFLRGFNLDHGTDFNVSVDGTPVNFRTHGHGQGYLDLNFIIPEIVQQVAFRKGPYYSDVGDFSAAATSEFRTYDQLPEGIAQATYGEFGYRRGLVADSIDLDEQVSVLYAFEAAFNESPFELDEDLKKYNGFVKYTKHTNKDNFSLSLSAYDAEWTSSDQVPERAIESGLIDRFGFIDPDLGGETTRIALNAQYDNDTGLAANAYALYYDFQLFSNFTYFLNDPVNGDEFEQADRRISLGGAATQTWDIDLGGRPAELRLGGETHFDNILDIGLFNTAGRTRLSTVRDDRVKELSAGLFTDVQVSLTETLRLTTGLRADIYYFDVESSIASNSDSGSDSIFTPNLSLAWLASDSVELYANYGQGFHSNDARGAAATIDPVSLEAIEPVDLLVRAEGAELGVRYQTADFNVSLSGFWLELDSELVFVGDAGTTEPNPGTRRFGIETALFWNPIERITFDASAAYTDARFRNAASNEDRIPQAVESVFSAGITVKATQDITSSLRLRHFGEAPLNESGSVTSDPTTLVNWGIYYDKPSFRLGLDILNLFDAEDADITYFFESQLPGETNPVEGKVFKPVEPRQIRATIGIKF